MAPLAPCPSCARHVRVAEAACPFCARALDVRLVATPHGPRRRYIGKGATALALTLAASACSGQGTVEPDVVDAARDATSNDAPSETASDAWMLDSGFATDTEAGDAPDEGTAIPIYK